MRVSKRQLKRVIREEKNKLIAETRLRRTVRRVIREGAGYDPTDPDFLAAKDPNTPVDVLLRIASNKSPDSKWARKEVARNPNASLEVLEELSGDETEHQNEMLGYYIAKHPNTTPELLQQLASSESIVTRNAVAQIPLTPVAALKQLANDSNEDVRVGLASNPSATGDILRRLATDQVKYVRIQVAKNPSTPTDTLETLTGDTVATVRNRAKKNLKSR